MHTVNKSSINNCVAITIVLQISKIVTRYGKIIAILIVNSHIAEVTAEPYSIYSHFCRSQSEGLPLYTGSTVLLNATCYKYYSVCVYLCNYIQF